MSTCVIAAQIQLIPSARNLVYFFVRIIIIKRPEDYRNERIVQALLQLSYVKRNYF